MLKYDWKRLVILWIARFGATGRFEFEKNYSLLFLKSSNTVSMTLSEILAMEESEDRVEFKEAKGQFSYNKGRKSVLGYVAALANEGGGLLVLGIKEGNPCEVVGSKAWLNKEGELEQKVYRDMRVRVEVEALHEDGTDRRVVVIRVPSRPVGKPLYFEDVPLMRVGDRLERMSEEMYWKIVQEQEPDFSARICEGLRLSDLSEVALKQLKERYGQRQGNPSFAALSDEQALEDLGLMSGGKLTYAALILLGKTEVLQSRLPQAKVVIEFRNTPFQIPYDWRVEIDESLLTGVDRIWEQVHARNSIVPIRHGPYIKEVLVFNEDVIREAVLNAVTHRDYSYTSETVIRQSPFGIEIYNPGGFPKGVRLENLISVSSTPRSRLMADVLLKVGLVERSGQGVDKLFAVSLSEGKSAPDYSESDSFQVSLKLDCEVLDGAFHLFLEQVQKEDGILLGVYDIITLAKVREGFFQGLDDRVLKRLESFGMVMRMGSGNSRRFLLGELYQELREEGNEIGGYIDFEIASVVSKLEEAEEVRMGELVDVFERKLNRSQVRYLIEKLVEDGILRKRGAGSGTRYRLAPKFLKKRNILEGVLQYLKRK